MLDTKKLITAMLASVSIYLIIFLFLVHKPLTVGIIGQYLERKTNYLSAINNNKIVILAGSNGRFSHRCETIEQEIKIPCANMSIAASFAISYIIDKTKPFLKAGDLVYLPLEYHQLRQSKKQMLSGLVAPYLAAYDKAYLFQLDSDGLLNSVGYFDLTFLISALGEMGLNAIGHERRFTLETMTPQGDERLHTKEKALPYRQYLETLWWQPPRTEDFDQTNAMARVLDDFLHWARQNQVIVVGGLPTTFNDKPIPTGLIKKLCRFYINRGHYFVQLPNNSQYDRTKFYDAFNHLNEQSQIAHSKRIGLALRKILQHKTKAGHCE